MKTPSASGMSNRSAGARFRVLDAKAQANVTSLTARGLAMPFRVEVCVYRASTGFQSDVSRSCRGFGGSLNAKPDRYFNRR